MSIPVSKVVRVSVLTSPTFPKRKGFGLLLIVTDEAYLPVGDRLRFYSDMDAVASDFPSNSEAYKAAQVFFGQSPKPVELAIGRAFSSAVPGELLGSVNATKTVATYQAITTGSLKMNIDGGTVEEVTGIDLSGCANLNAVAAAIDTAFTQATVSYDGTRFIVRSTTTGATSTVDYAVTPSTGTDLGPLLGLREADLGIKTAGKAAEAMADSLQALQDWDPSWYGFTLAKATISTQDILDCAAWAEARIKIFGYTTSNSDVQDSASSSDLASTLKDLGYSRTIGQWDNNDKYAVISAIARGFVVNFAEQDSTLTLKFKLQPGVTPVNITETQRLALVSKNINYYTYFGDSAMLAEGVMANGRFFDEVHGIDWLQNAVENNVFGYLYTRTTKVPQTDKGVAALVQQAEKALQEGVRNGLLAPGVWNGADLGEVKSGSFLPKGFYVYAQPVADQPQADREARKAPPIQAIAKGAGAIHSVDVSITFER